MFRRGLRRVLHLRPSRGGLETEIEEEMQHHLAALEEGLQESGLSAEEARREAERRFGSVRHHSRDCRKVMKWTERWGGVMWFLESVKQDIRYALRGTWRRPGFSAAIILTLGLGLGSTTAIFSVIDATMLRPLPYPEPDRLVLLGELQEGDSNLFPVFRRFTLAREVSATSTFFTSSVVLHRQNFTRTDREIPQLLDGHAVTRGFHSTVGVGPSLGRGFSEDDFLPSASDVMILTHELWQADFAGRADVIGEVVRLNERPVTVVGVMPRGFKFPLSATNQFWTPLKNNGEYLGLSALEVRTTASVARLPTGMTQDELDERLVRLTGLFQDQLSPEARLGARSYGANRLVGPQNDPIRRGLIVLLVASGLMLLVAAANAANLLLVRASTRRSEFAIRGAIGASRRRVTRQLTTETLLLASIGGVVAIYVAMLGIHAVQELFPVQLTVFSVHAVEVEQRAIVFAFGLSVFVGLLAVIGPALALPTSKKGAMDRIRTGIGSRRSARLRSGFLVTQVAAAATLLLGAGLVAKSFYQLSNVSVGFRTDDVISVTLNLAPLDYPNAAERSELALEFERRLEQLPGVLGVTFGNSLPPRSGVMEAPDLRREGGPVVEAGALGLIPGLSVRPDAFDVLDIPILSGRSFEPGDEDIQGQVIIGQTLAEALWGTADPVGQRFQSRDNGPWYTVVGVAGEIKLQRPDDPIGRFEVYTPLAAGNTPYFLNFGVHTSRPLGDIGPDIRTTFADIDPLTPLFGMDSLAEFNRGTMRAPKFLMVVMVGFTAVALVLAFIGVYGVVSVSVTERFREIGIRMALGATAPEVQGFMVRRGVIAGIAGVLAGVILGSLVFRFLESILFEVQATDPMVIGGIALFMVAVTAVASYLPTRRMARFDPAKVLRAE